MATSTIEANVVKLVRDHWTLADVKNVHISDRVPSFLRGTLYVVSIVDADDEEHKNYVYAEDDELNRYNDVIQLAKERGGESPLRHFFKGSSPVFVVAGIIGIAVTATVCYLSTHGQGAVPPHLLAAFQLILGFFFGTVARAGTK